MRFSVEEMKIVLETEGMPAVFETHIAKLTTSFHVDGKLEGLGINSSDLLGVCTCGWASTRYPYPDTWFDDHPTRVAIRQEIWEHIIAMLNEEAGAQ